MDHSSYSSFSNLVTARRSCRSYDIDRPVDPALLRAVVDAARRAPSAVNRQPWHFIVITTDPAHAGAREAVLKVYDRKWIATAPALIVCCCNHNEAWHRGADGKDHSDIDIAIATEHICLAAAALGLGSCWVCNFDPAPLAAAVELPEGVEPAAIIPIGYPSATATDGEFRPATTRKPLDDILSWGKF